MPYSPQDVYARQLLSYRGYPLWTPEPSNEFLAYRRDGLKIGDVGIIIPGDGCFDVFFNTCLSRNHPFHRATGVPENFEPIELDDVDIRTVVNAENPGRVISTSSVRRIRTTERSGGGPSSTTASTLEHEFNLSSSEGALLILPEGAQRHDLRNYHRFLEAATQHGADWYRFAEERVGQITGHDSLYLITGLYKTRSWSLAAFEKTAGATEYPAQFKASQVEGANIAATYTWETTRSLDWRAGPIENSGIPNQTVFIRGFKIALRAGMLGTRRISVKADAPSTRQNPRKSVGSAPRSSWLGYIFDGSSTGRLVESGSMQDKVIADSALDTARNEIPNNGALAVGERVVIQRVPDVPQAFHPSDIINQYLLNKDPSASIAITHDDDWITMLEENLLRAEDLAQYLESFFASLPPTYDVVSNQGVVYLQSRRKGNSDASHDGSKVDATTGRRGFDFKKPVTTVINAAPSKSHRSIGLPRGLRDRRHATPRLLRGHDGSISSVAFISGDRIISASNQDGTIRQWNTLNGKNVVVKVVMWSAVAMSPNGRQVVIGGRDGRVRSFELEAPKAVMKSAGRHADVIKSLAFSPDSLQMASGAQDGTIFVWSTTTLEPVVGPLKGHRDSVWWVCYSPDGRKIASCDREIIQVWDSTTWVGVAINGQAWSLAWSPYGDTLFAGCVDGAIKCYNPDTGRPLAAFAGHSDVVFSIAVSHNAKFIATASWDKTVCFWEPTTLEKIGPSLRHDAQVHCISISPDDSHLVSGARDPHIRVWNLRTIIPSISEDLPYKSEYVPPTNHEPNSEPGALSKLRSSHLYAGRKLPALPFEPPRLVPREGNIAHTPRMSLDLLSTGTSQGNVLAVDNESENDSFIRETRSDPTHDLTGNVVAEDSNLAAGSHGDIYTGTLRLNGRAMRVAIKAAKKYTSRGDEQSRRRRLGREIKRYLVLDHKNVLPLLGTTKAYGDLPAMVYPWAENGSLTGYLDRRNNDLTTQLRLGMIGDVASGLQYLHSESIVHGDISGSNILIHGSGRACIANFSLSMVDTEINEPPVTWEYQIRGTLRYMAPELLHVSEKEDEKSGDNFPTFQSDIYSFGCIMLHVLTGKVPYHYMPREEMALLSISKGELPRRPTVVTDSLWEFMMACWSPVPKNRPSHVDMVAFVQDQILSCLVAGVELTGRNSRASDVSGDERTG